MSMPTIPETGLDITEEQALNMLLASIAMEEMSLSHIMNAEGEKLQYVLGTLSNKNNTCATTKELLEVNKSITKLLDSVVNNQILLKGKLQQVLEAKEKFCPVHNYFPCYDKRTKAEIVLKENKKYYCWNENSKFPWKCQLKTNISWSEHDPYTIILHPQKQYIINFSFYFNEDYGVEVAVQTIKNNNQCILKKFCSHNSTLTGSLLVSATDCSLVPISFLLLSPSKCLVLKAEARVLSVDI